MTWAFIMSVEIKSSQLSNRWYGVPVPVVKTQPGSTHPVACAISYFWRSR